MITEGNAAEVLEIAKARRSRRIALEDFYEFLPYWQFKDRETGEVRSFTHEEIWEGQLLLIEAAQEHDWVLALKAGKLGFTELECAYDAWRALGPKNARVHIFSRDFTAAQELLEYVRFGLEHLPKWFNVTLAAKERGGDIGRSLKFYMGPDDMRTVMAYASGANVSIDQSCCHAHVDELAIMLFAEKTWNAINSTVAPGGTCHIVSRGAGEDVYLKVLWDAAVENPGGDIFPFFTDWRKRPGRDDRWRDLQAAKMTPQGLRYYAPETAADALSGEETEQFVPIEAWDACYELLPPFEPATMTEVPVVIAVDAASTGDCFAVVAITRHPDPERSEDVALRACRVWKPPGHGREINYAEPEAFIRALCIGGCALGHSQEPQFAALHEECPACQDRVLIPPYNVIVVTYDPYQLTDMMQRINREVGVWTKSFDQGGRRLKSDRQLYDLIIQRRLAHHGDSDVREHIQNAHSKLEKGQDSKLRIVKKAQDKKVDLVVAISMGSYECLRMYL